IVLGSDEFDPDRFGRPGENSSGNGIAVLIQDFEAGGRELLGEGLDHDLAVLQPGFDGDGLDGHGQTHAYGTRVGRAGSGHRGGPVGGVIDDRARSGRGQDHGFAEDERPARRGGHGLRDLFDNQFRKGSVNRIAVAHAYAVGGQAGKGAVGETGHLFILGQGSGRINPRSLGRAFQSRDSRHAVAGKEAARGDQGRILAVHGEGLVVDGEYHAFVRAYGGVHFPGYRGLGIRIGDDQRGRYRGGLLRAGIVMRVRRDGGFAAEARFRFSVGLQGGIGGGQADGSGRHGAGSAGSGNQVQVYAFAIGAEDGSVFAVGEGQGNLFGFDAAIGVIVAITEMELAVGGRPDGARGKGSPGGVGELQGGGLLDILVEAGGGGGGVAVHGVLIDDAQLIAAVG